MDGKVHHFGPSGLRNGLVVLSDEETWSRWDHITGECFEGPLQGRRLEVWPVHITTVAAALAEDPELTISLSGHRSVGSLLLRLVMRSFIHGRGFLPPPFYRTMAGKIDPRLGKLTQGLGVIEGKAAKFYPMDAIPRGEAVEDVWRGRRLRVERRAWDGSLRAVWMDTGEEPMQLLSRWYGFSFTYPGCTIYGAE